MGSAPASPMFTRIPAIMSGDILISTYFTPLPMKCGRVTTSSCSTQQSVCDPIGSGKLWVSTPLKGGYLLNSPFSYTIGSAVHSNNAVSTDHPGDHVGTIFSSNGLLHPDFMCTASTVSRRSAAYLASTLVTPGVMP